MAPPRKSARLALELAAKPTGRLRKRFHNLYVLHRLCELADEKTNCGDRDGLRVARLCCRLAEQLKTPEARALSFARLATALRFANRLGHAEQAIEIAIVVAPSYTVGDLFRRRAWIRMVQGRLADAVQDAEKALEQTIGSEEAMAHDTLGVAHYYSGHYRKAICELKHSLAKTDPDATTFYCNALHNYATALAQGTDQEATEALILCAELRSKLKDRHKMQRAKLWWIAGLLHERLGDLDEKAWWSLNVAKRSLIALKAAPEVAAIVADMARVAPQPLAVRQICFEAEEVIVAPHPLSEPLRTLASARGEVIPGAAAALHRAACAHTACIAL